VRSGARTAVPGEIELTAEEIARSPQWLPVEAAGDRVSLVRLDEAAYRRASFLDQRLFASGHTRELCPRAMLEAAAAGVDPPAHFIFHTGHVGSTLISRLVGEHSAFFALREPAVLRAIAAPVNGDDRDRALSLEVALALLGRTWHPGQRAIVKATSFVSELAVRALAVRSRPSAILLFARPLEYLRGIFAGPASRAETRQLAPARLGRLARRLGTGEPALEVRSEGEWVAMSWACEMSALRAAADRYGSQVLWVDFDAFLAEPAATLEAILRALRERPDAREIERLLSGPQMRQYSKAPEYAYDAALRRAVLAEAGREHGAEIDRGVRWLERLAQRHTNAQRLLP
jgi:hypothetical protein